MATRREMDDFEKLILRHKKRRQNRNPINGVSSFWQSRKKKNQWGTVLDFLRKAKERPEMADSAHQRFYRVLVEKPGWKDIPASENPKLARALGIPANGTIRSYNFIEDEFFGAEEFMNRVVYYFFAAKEGGEESRQILYLRGPAGTGKSSFVGKMKRALEDEELYCLEGCPQHDHPFWILPRSLRTEFSELLGIPIPSALDICPVCGRRLKEEFNNDYEKFPVEKIKFSKRRNIGISSVKPVDPNNQDVRVLIGSEKISVMHKYPEGDSQGWSLNGGFNKANRGLVELEEIFKNPTEFLRTLLGATQEKSVPSPGYYQNIDVDTVIMAHSNWGEWEKFSADSTEEPMIDRMYIIDAKNCLRMSAEEEIYKKLVERISLGHKIHTAPYLYKMVAAFAVLSRMLESKKCGLMEKLFIYDGEEVFPSGSSEPISVSELKNEDPLRTIFEGKDGITLRFAVKAIDKAIARKAVHEHTCVDFLDVCEVLEEAILSESTFTEEEKERYLSFLVSEDYLPGFYLENIKLDCVNAFVKAKGYKYNELCQAVFNEYLKNVRLFDLERKFKETNKDAYLPPSKCNFALLDAVESQLGFKNDEQKNEFRSRVAEYASHLEECGDEMGYKDYPVLHKTIFSIVQNELLKELIGALKDNDGKDKVWETINELKEKGYCAKCASKALWLIASDLT